MASKDNLKAKAIGALRHLQEMLGLVRVFFTDPDLHYVAAAG